jgi:hypothetical protein
MKWLKENVPVAMNVSLLLLSVLVAWHLDDRMIVMWMILAVEIRRLRQSLETKEEKKCQKSKV